MALKSLIGALSIEITADSKKLKSELKNANTMLRKGGKELRKNVNQWGKWGAAAATAVTGVSTALVKANLTNIRELNNMARAGNTTVAVLQQQSMAATQAGVSQEKYADILKDVNDRIGDFVQTGGGPMIDFFEKIAPKVGVTVEQFRKLSGPDALQLYVSSLEKANVNQQDMTFFMEAIASDSTRLLPLLKDNGEAMNRMASDARSLGVGLSEIDVEKALAAQQALDKVSALLSNELLQATAELAPFITVLSNEFFAAAENSGGFAKHTVEGLEAVGNAVAILGNGIKGIQIIFQTIKVAALGFTSLVTVAFKELVTALNSLGNHMLDNWRTVLTKMASVAGTFSDSMKESLTEMADDIKASQKDIPDFIKELADSQVQSLEIARDELHNMANEPLPTQQFDEFINNVKKKVAEAAPEIRANLTGGKPQDDKSKGDGQDDKINKVAQFEAETVGLLEAMALRFESQNEMRLAQMQREKEMLRAQFEAGEIAAREHADRMTEITRNMEETKRQITVDNLQQGFQAMAQNSKKVQKLMQGVAIVNAVIKGKEAAVAAWSAGMATGGPFAPLVAAAYTAASIARTSSMIQSIKSSGKSMGGMSGGAGSGASRAAASASAADTGSGGGGDATPTRRIDINMMGSAAMQQWMREEIIPAFNQALGDNVELNTGG